MHFFLSNEKKIDQLIFMKNYRPIRNLMKEYINTNKKSLEKEF
jgi:hypothetical protein